MTGHPPVGCHQRMPSLASSVTIAEAAEALDWQHHTIRGAMAGALKKKLGLTIDSEEVDGRGRVYRLA